LFETLLCGTAPYAIDDLADHLLPFFTARGLLVVRHAGELDWSTRIANVLIIQSVMKQYRVPFFTGLRGNLRRDGIDLKVAYSEPTGVHASRGDGAELPEPWGAKVRGYWLLGRFLYQPLWNEISRADLVIVTPELKSLISLVLLLISALGLKTVAFWGLGPNLHPDRSRIAEWIKARIFIKVDWWFAYTDTVAEYLRKKGMPRSQITVVQNATDTRGLRGLMSEISDAEAIVEKMKLTGSADGLIGLYVGMIQQIKAIPFLIETARLVRQECPEFHLVLIGSGPDRRWLEGAIAGESWIHYMGSVFGRQSALHYRMADVSLLGGTAGLAVVDSFAAGLPLLATHLPTHPPEISYVREGYNGRLSPHSSRAFASMILDTLRNPILIEQLRRGAAESGGYYTIEAMVRNFAGGIRDCLKGAGITLHEQALGAPTQAD
jgi:glycosyltransferase involved in cell wall biosynthesis